MLLVEESDPIVLSEALELARRLGQRTAEWCERHVTLPADNEALDAAQIIVTLAEEVRRRRRAAYGGGPVCQKCEIDQGLGSCRCDIAANE